MSESNLAVEFGAIFPRIKTVAGDEVVAKWLLSYEQAFARRDWERFENLRAFPLFLRNENRLRRLNQPWLIDLALWEWTEFNTLYSPMNEIAERESLADDEILLNPTTQILRLENDLIAWMDEGQGAIPPQDKTMALIFRKQENGVFKLAHRRAEWMSAALLDVLLENGRTKESVFWSEIREHHGSNDSIEWKTEMNSLVESGVVLRR